ncbi:diguanylate cyclase (GGDEF) domain-containing protein [Parafrankia irregularis]|uniref:Diguanylate cyclase (GGDEF) domain-containing protein n=1 Tax=Parafrankia irregularis TaxID=795642 RepID=A0A0S4QH84_9ACTN|nr:MULTISPECIES: GGDEF domain-containing protein [Parafrankia]MBE3203220.1 diguanylate cyclase [Parafrankia sp. CH37]CUU54136.1 diguanylate cyclase (GGDEF) domain-containing protein [Parafrankia irregularis]
MITDDLAAVVLDSLPSRIAVLGPDGTVVRLNDAWRRSAAAGLAVVPVRPGTSWLAACDTAGQDAAPLRQLALLTRRMLNSRREQVHLELPVSSPRGERWVDVRIRGLSRGDGLVVVVDDVTERHGQAVALRQRALHDPVTGLPNRLALRDLIDDALEANAAVEPGYVAPPGRTSPSERRTPPARASSASPPPTPGPVRAMPARVTTTRAPAIGRPVAPGTENPGVAVLFLDLDRFRLVNERYGYAVGDSTLCEVTRRFQAVLGSDALLGHWGGDEFVIVMPKTTSSAATLLADQVGSSLAEPMLVDGQQIQITVSVGLAFVGRLRSGHDVAASPRPLGSAAAMGTAGSGTPPSDAEALVRAAGDEVVRARGRRFAPSNDPQPNQLS